MHCQIVRPVSILRVACLFSAGKEVFLRDIWPSPATVSEVVETVLLPSLFMEAYQNIQQGNERSVQPNPRDS